MLLIIESKVSIRCFNVCSAFMTIREGLLYSYNDIKFVKFVCGFKYFYELKKIAKVQILFMVEKQNDTSGA